jgi:hypothetical protein
MSAMEIDPPEAGPMQKSGAASKDKDAKKRFEVKKVTFFFHLGLSFIVYGSYYFSHQLFGLNSKLY